MKSQLRRILAGACLALTLAPAFGAGGQGRAAVEGPDTKALGVFRDSASPSAAFTVRNAGDGPLAITGIMKTCGCADAAADTNALAPGGAATVRVSIAPYTLEGAFSKSVFVLTDTTGQHPLRLTVTGQCVPLFSVKPSKMIDAGRIPEGAAWEGAFEIEASAAAVLGVPAVTSDCPAEVSLEPAAGTKNDLPRWRVPVRLSPPANGGFRCRITIPSLVPTNRPPLSLEIAGRAGSEIVAAPTTIIYPLLEQPATRTVRLRLAGARSRTLAPGQLQVTPETEGLTVRADPDSGGWLKVGFTASPALSRRLAESGQILITLAVPDASPATVILQAPSSEKGGQPGPP